MKDLQSQQVELLQKCHEQLIVQKELSLVQVQMKQEALKSSIMVLEATKQKPKP